MPEDYMLFYSDKKKEDIIFIKSMFSKNMQLELIWIDKDFTSRISKSRK